VLQPASPYIVSTCTTSHDTTTQGSLIRFQPSSLEQPERPKTSSQRSRALLNRACAVSVHAASDTASCPLQWRLFLPKEWASDNDRRTKTRNTERTGLPLSVGISGATLHDSQALIPLMKGTPPIRSRRGRRRRKPGKLHADKGYDYSHLRRWLRERGITHRIARKGIETSQRLRLGRHHWTIERTMAWPAGAASTDATNAKPRTS
jgi:hypothetical protein